MLSASSFAQAPAPGAAPSPAPGTPATTGTTPAAPGAAAATPAPKPLGPSEKGFLKNAAKSAAFQIALSKAAQPATDKSVAKVRDDAIKDLTKVLNKLTEVATGRGEKVETELQGMEKSDVERLGKAKEDKMGKEYIEAILKESKKLDRDFESAGKTLQDPDIVTVVRNYNQLVHGVFTASEGVDKAMKAPKKK